VWYPGATYHIISRGVRRLPLFYDEQDRRVYLNQLQEAKKPFPYYLHTYCLMPNHIHLLIETINHSPSEIIKLLHTRYAIYFKHRYQITGHVFESRYTGKLIDNTNYFLEVSRYIHRNPLEASLDAKLQDPLWTSYSYFTSTDSSSSLITTEKVLSYFSHPILENYDKHLNKGSDPY
jgi:REP element-mobilizing transposase RayT